MDQKEIRKHIGKALQQARKNKGWKSADEYAKHMGINSGTYTGYEQGKSSFNVDQAWLFAEDLGIDVNTLIGFYAIVAYSDPSQEALNHYYESMNAKGREALLNTAELMSGSPDTRIEKDSPECFGVQTEMDGVA